MEVTTEQLAHHDAETLKHIAEVNKNLQKLLMVLAQRGADHDQSKLASPEREIYALNTPELAKTVYGTPEYDALLQKVKPAIEHHYSKNRHHPEHWPNGVDDMDLVDMMEMLADWAAATKRNKNGNIHKSIEVNTTRFKMTPQLARILTNTVERYF